MLTHTHTFAHTHTHICMICRCIYRCDTIRYHVLYTSCYFVMSRYASHSVTAAGLSCFAFVAPYLVCFRAVLWGNAPLRWQGGSIWDWGRLWCLHQNWPDYVGNNVKTSQDIPRRCMSCMTITDYMILVHVRATAKSETQNARKPSKFGNWVQSIADVLDAMTWRTWYLRPPWRSNSRLAGFAAFDLAYPVYPILSYVSYFFIFFSIFSFALVLSHPFPTCSIL